MINWRDIRSPQELKTFYGEFAVLSEVEKNEITMNMVNFLNDYAKIDAKAALETPGINLRFKKKVLAELTVQAIWTRRLLMLNVVAQGELFSEQELRYLPLRDVSG